MRSARIRAAVAAGDASEAVALYRGDLLEGFEDEWLEAPRERFRELQVRLLLDLVAEEAGRRRRTLPESATPGNCWPSIPGARTGFAPSSNCAMPTATGPARSRPTAISLNGWKPRWASHRCPRRRGSTNASRPSRRRARRSKAATPAATPAPATASRQVRPSRPTARSFQPVLARAAIDQQRRGRAFRPEFYRARGGTRAARGRALGAHGTGRDLRVGRSRQVGAGAGIRAPQPRSLRRGVVAQR